jgi:hypothetical protein
MPNRTTLLSTLALTPVLAAVWAGPARGQAGPSVSLVGLVRDSAGAPLRDVEVAVDSSIVLVRSDTLGRFAVASLAPGPHTLRFERPGLVPMRMRAEIPADAGDVALSLGEIVLRAAPQRLLRVSIAFTDATSGRAVEGVVVSVGRRVVGYGDRKGHFQHDSVRLREGEEWSFRRLGYQPTIFELWPAEGQSALDLMIKLTPIAITLGPVIVQGDVSRALTPWMRDFEQRRQAGWGAFLGEEDIQKHRASLSATGLLRWAGVNVMGDEIGLSGRSLQVFGAHCWPPGPPVIFLDGVHLTEQSALDWLDMYSPDELAGVEVYNSPGDIPPLFNATGSDCGVIAVWTKR